MMVQEGGASIRSLVTTCCCSCSSPALSDPNVACAQWWRMRLSLAPYCSLAFIRRPRRHRGVMLLGTCRPALRCCFWSNTGWCQFLCSACLRTTKHERLRCSKRALECSKCRGVLPKDAGADAATTTSAPAHRSEACCAESAHLVHGASTAASCCAPQISELRKKMTFWAAHPPPCARARALCGQRL